ncbi:MAG: hypothetical protein H0X24_02540 [Ktedonobacterales bacterium]|nr:hypothetical protein [Ktedonobacterales bacterium]
MLHIRNHHSALALFCGTLLVLLAACTATSTVTTATPIGTVAGSTPTAASDTPTSVPATCAALLSGAGPASGGPSFSDLPFPADSVSTGLTPVHSGTGSYTVSTFAVCSSGTSAAAVRSFYVTNLGANAWATDPTLPFDGAFQQPCGDPYCWQKGANPVARRLLGLESVTDRGNNVVTYQWRVFVPPPAGTCNVADMTTGGNSFGNGGPDDGFQYPPVTSYNDFGGAAGSHGYRMCSAGNASTIAAFLKNSIGKGGWKVLSSSPTGVHAQKPNPSDPTFCYTVDVFTGSHGANTGEWDINFHIPAAMCV